MKKSLSQVSRKLNIKSKATHYKYKKPGEESIKFSNIINGNWDTRRPFKKLYRIQQKYGLKENHMIGRFI